MNDSIEISVVDGGVESLGKLDRTKLERAYSLNLHHNMIRCIEGLGSAINLRHIDLSSNFITKICGLERLSSLRTMNLSSNRIRRVEGLKYLKSLVRLDLSFNQLEDLEGLKELHGHDYRLTVVHLQGNRLTSLGHLICCTVGLIYLKQLTVYDHEIEANNPLCHVPDYRRLVMNGLPQLEILDNLDWNDRPVRLDVLADLPELSRFLDYVSSSSLSEANETERQIQEACIRDVRSRTRSRPTRMLPLETSVVQTESHNVHVDPGESSNNHPQCSFSPLTERRLINLENQLSSLVAMQLMRLNEPMHVKSSSPPPPPLPMQPAPTTTTPLSPTVHQVPSSQTQAALTDMIPRSNELRREDPGATDEFHPTSRVRQSRRMSNVDCVESHQPRSKSRRATNEVPIKRSTGEHPPSTLTSARKPEDTNRLQTICRLNSGSTVQTNQTAGQEMDTYRPTASPGEDHPPGAPKRPAGNMKVAKPSSSHATHGKPLSPRRPSSIPGASMEVSRSIPSLSSGSDSGSYSRNAPRRAGPILKRGDTQESQRAQIKTNPTRNGNDVADKTLGQVLKELDSERTQRKEAEQLCRDLTERILRLEAAAADETKALEATDKLKQAFTAERRARVAAEAQLRELDARLSEVFAAVDTMRVREAVEKSRTSEETNKMSIRLVELAKDYQDAIGRAERAEKKLDEVQCALKTKELEFKELHDTRYSIDSPEVTQLIAARVEAVEARHLQTIRTLQEKLNDTTDRFARLEDEFRMALRIEADRYNELFNSSEVLKSRVSELDEANRELQQREESARQLVAELTTAMKEQKSKATSQQKSNLLVQHNQKERIATLETHLEEARSRLTNIENLKNQEQKHIKAELAAQESLVAGLRAERRNWSEELAQQSSALAQDRGRLESKIEAQAIEIVSLKKSLENEVDAVKIKTKIIDDQADSIRNLKKALVDTQNELKRAQTESLQIQQKLEDQISQLKRELEESTGRIQRLLARKGELKDTVVELEAKLDEMKSQNDAMSSRWHDRATLLDKLEKQVEQMRRGWDKEQQLLIAERDEAKAHSAALQEQMERMDSSFRKQLSATIEANDRAISAARSDAEMIRSNCENRVAEVEAEMRVVLEETEEARRAMEARLRKISTVLYDPSSTDCTSTPDRPVLHGYYPHTCPHVNEWRTTPPPPPPPMPHPTISSGFSSSVPVGPPVHSCSRATRPNSPFEQEIGPVCESGTCCSPH